MRTREEQIQAFVDANQDSICHEDYRPDDLRMMLNAAIQEAEQRVRAEIGRDSERLDWLADAVSSIGGKNGDPVVWKIMFLTQSKLTGCEHIREAIEAARNEGE